MYNLRISIILTAFILPIFIYAQTISKNTYTFANINDQVLKLDFYTNNNDTLKPCIVFVFGGGFKDGTRDSAEYNNFFNYFAERGYSIASIDYRLGMKNASAPGIFNTKPLRNAISMAVDDLYSATSYLLENASILNIDTTKIIICGTSAGAITVLQADYEERDNKPSADILPDWFHYSGVISFSGAIFSTEGQPSYSSAPAPTLFFHGSADRLVTYNKKQFLKLGLFGSKSLAKSFRNNGYPYIFYSMDGMGHDVATYPMNEFLPEINQFLIDFVFDRKQWMIDIDFKDKLRKSDTSENPDNFYN